MSAALRSSTHRCALALAVTLMALSMLLGAPVAFAQLIPSLSPLDPAVAERDAEILQRAPRSANPYLAFLPTGVEPDYEWWNAKMRAASQERRPLPAGFEEFFEIEPNDSPADPDFLPGIGTGPGDNPDALVTGTGDFFEDRDYFAVDLEAGDVIGVATTAPAVYLIDPSPLLRMGSNQNASGSFPPEAPLPSGPVSAAIVAPVTGRYFVRVDTVLFTNYELGIQISRPGTERAGITQTIFVDFDGATVDPSIFGGPAGNVALSPLSSFLAGWGLGPGDENAVINSILANLEENLSQDLQATGNNPDQGIIILNSRDHADPFGQPGVSRLIVGGTEAQLGIGTIGIAESIDPGNFGLEESAVTLLDSLSGPSNSGDSLNQFPLAPGATKIDLVGRGVGNITTHEAGHYLGNFHTDQFNGTPNIQDQGGNLPGTVGVGPDGIFGNGDDVDVDFVEDVFVAGENFLGIEDTRNTTAFGLTGTVIFRNDFESNSFDGWGDVVP